MAEASTLAGTIGTWVAVFLAVIALAGILPAYILYQKSRTTRAQALASVDDPDQSFISHSFSLMGAPINMRIQAPDLRGPPDQQAMDVIGNLDLSKLGSLESSTCWVNFAHLMQSLFPGIGTSSGEDMLRFEDRQSYLPVHYLWILCVGVLHRYAIRKDYGLPLGSSPEEHSTRRHADQHISGLSGMILKRFSSRHDDEVKLYFEAHPPGVIREALNQDPIALRELILRFLGIIQMAPNTYFKATEIRDEVQTYVPGKMRFSERAMIANIVSSGLPRDDRHILNHLTSVRDQTSCLYLKVVLARNIMEPSERRYDFLAPPVSSSFGRQDLLDKAYFEIGDWKLRSLGLEANIWMKRREIHRIVLTYLKAKMSPVSFLYDASRDIIASKLLKAEDLSRTLDLAKPVIAGLHLEDQVKLRLQHAVNAVTDTDLATQSWSRHAMQTFYSLDLALEAVGRPEGFMWDAIAILYAYDTDFRSVLKQAAEDAKRHENPRIRFDVEKSSLEFPSAENLVDTRVVAFDFQHTFAQMIPTEKITDSDMSLAQAVLAALHGHVRTVMWTLCLSPGGLGGICSLERLRQADICLLGAIPAGGFVRPRSRSQSRSPSPASQSASSRSSHASRDYSDSLENALGKPPRTAAYHIRPPSSQRSMVDAESAGYGKLGGWNALLRNAASEGDLGLLSLLLNKRAPLDSGGRRLDDALQAASYAGHINAVRLLLERGANVDSQDENYYDAVVIATQRQHADIVQLLVDGGARCADSTENESGGLESSPQEGTPRASRRAPQDFLSTNQLHIAQSSVLDRDLGTNRSDRGKKTSDHFSIDRRGPEAQELDADDTKLPGSQSPSSIVSGSQKQPDDDTQDTGAQELFKGEIRDANDTNHTLRLIQLQSGALRIEGRSFDRPTEGFPVWTAFLTVHAAGHERGFMYLVSQFLVIMCCPNTFFYIGPTHRLPETPDGNYVLDFERSQEAQSLVRIWHRLVESRH